MRTKPDGWPQRVLNVNKSQQQLLSLLLAISYIIVSCVNVCVCGGYIVSDCVLDERLCTVWCMCSINSICVL